MDERAGASGKGRARVLRQRAQWTLADLGILVAGCAVAFSLPWLNDTGAQVWFVTGRADGWFLLARATVETLQKTALALLPLALWRRARRGGVISAGEFLLAVCVAPLLAAQVDRLPWIRSSYYSRYFEASDVFRQTPGAPFWYVNCAAGVLFASAALVLGFARKRLPAWERSVLLVIAYLAAVPRIFEALGECVDCYLASIPGEPSALAYALTIAVELPFGVVPAVIGFAALRDRVRHEPATLLEWLGLILALFVLLTWFAEAVYIDLYIRTPTIDVSSVAIEYGLLVGAGVIAGSIVWRFGGAWRRWVEQEE